jgi:hypothetical protein
MTLEAGTPESGDLHRITSSRIQLLHDLFDVRIEPTLSVSVWF